LYNIILTVKTGNVRTVFAHFWRKHLLQRHNSAAPLICSSLQPLTPHKLRWASPPAMYMVLWRRCGHYTSTVSGYNCNGDEVAPLRCYNCHPPSCTLSVPGQLTADDLRNFFLKMSSRETLNAP